MLVRQMIDRWRFKLQISMLLYFSVAAISSAVLYKTLEGLLNTRLFIGSAFAGRGPRRLLQRGRRPSLLLLALPRVLCSLPHRNGMLRWNCQVLELPSQTSRWRRRKSPAYL